MSNQQPQRISTLVITLLPAAVILLVYAFICYRWPSATAQEARALRDDITRLQSGQIDEAQREDLAQQVGHANDLLNQKAAKLQALQSKATSLLKAGMTPVEKIQTERRVHGLFRDFGLRMVSQKPAGDRNMRLLRSLNVATEELGAVLTSMAAQEASDNQVALPPDLPLDVSPEEWLAEQRRQQSENFSGPRTTINRLQLVGSYQSMQQSLKEIANNCPQVVVTSAAFRMPEVSTAAPTPLIWDIRYQLRPTSVATVGENGGLVAASKSSRKD